MMVPEASRALMERAKDWVRQDPNPHTSRYVQSLIDDAAAASSSSSHRDDCHESLASLFPGINSQQRISFGTAGLRACMKPGPMGMNDLVVIQTAQGLARYCQKQQQQQQQQQASAGSSAVTSTTSSSCKIAAVVGYDHRANPALNLSSLQFALLTHLVFMEAGMQDCWLLDGLVATPMVPFAMRQLQLEHYHQQQHRFSHQSLIVLGIMITASHNPKQDAGYKVYWGGTGTGNPEDEDGYCCQITSPRDAEIARCILENLEPWVDYGALLHQQAQQNDNKNDPCLGLSQPARTQELIQSYFRDIASSGLLVRGQKLAAQLQHLQTQPPDTTTSSSIADDQTMTTTNDSKLKKKIPKFCYTALHGVGYRYARTMMLETLGLPSDMFVSVPQQQEPDCNFPTVSFPNPEEKGALNLAQEYALQHGCNIILANDPDADRLAVAEYNDDDDKNNDNNQNWWTVFTGDQIGTMLAHWLWQQVGSKLQNGQGGGNNNTTKQQPVAMLASIVSSKMLAEIARVEGFHFEDTLTGFKWIGTRAAELERKEGYRSLFCYEEAIGFCCGTGAIFDKDGISALGVFSELALSVYHDHGMTLKQHLQCLYDKYGEFVSSNGYFFLPDVSVVPKLMNEITNHGRFDTLDSVGPYKVCSIRYLGEPGYDSSKPDKKPTLPTSAASPILSLWFDNGCVVQLRASGTEPKFKYYIELKGVPGVSRATVQQELETMSSVILQELLHPEQNGFVRP